MAMEGLCCLLKLLTVTELALKKITTFYIFLFMKEKKGASYKKDPEGGTPTGLQYVTVH